MKETITMSASLQICFGFFGDKTPMEDWQEP